MSYFWAADAERWRCDCTRLYPTTGHDFALEIYDGERYTSIDTDGGLPTISGHPHGPSVSFEMPTKLHSNFWLGLYLPETLDACAGAGYKNFQYIGEVQLAGRRGLQYRSVLPQGDVTICFDADVGLPLKVRESNHWKKDYSNILSYTWSDVRKVDGIDLPFEFKYEEYDIRGGVMSWRQTVVTKLGQCELNGKLDPGCFENVLRPGTEVEDEITNPGGLTIVGGNLSADVRAVRGGHTPPLDEPNVKAN